MNNRQTLTYSYKELATMMVKAGGLHEGLWAIYIELDVHGGNAGPDPHNMHPVAVVPIVKIGLQQISESASRAIPSLSADAAVVNPRSTYDSLESIVKEWT